MRESVACGSAVALCAGLLFVGGVLCTPSNAHAQEAGQPTFAGPQVHAFVSQGFIKTTHNNYLAQSERGSLEFSEVGLNLTQSITDELRVGVQLFTHDLGPLGNYEPQFDWFYLDYRFRDWFGIRAGRTKIPFGLYNEANDVDSSRVPILLPQSVYPIDHRDYLLAQTGGEIYGNLQLGQVGRLEYRAYGGTLFMQPGPPKPGISLLQFDMPYVVGGRAMWQTPIEGLQVGGSFQALRFDAKYALAPELLKVFQALGYLPPMSDGVLPVKFRVRLWVGSIEYTFQNLLLAAEYSRWTGEFESNAPALFPSHIVNERYYVMASYRVASWFTPGLYYSVYYPDMSKRDGRSAYQRDAAISLRYDLNAHWLLKLEGHVMNGTAALDSALNDGKEVGSLPSAWGAFLAKTTAYF